MTDTFTYFVSYVCGVNGVEAMGNTYLTLDRPVTGIKQIRAIEQWFREEENLESPIILFWRLFEKEEQRDVEHKGESERNRVKQLEIQ